MKDKHNSEAIGIIILLFIIGIVYWLTHLFGGDRRSRKSDLAKRYGLAKSESLMKWIAIFCPPKIAEKYVGNKKHYIKESDIFPHLGEPEDYPKDEDGRDIGSKSEIMAALNTTRMTLQRRVERLKNPELEIGMTLEQYKRQKRFPPHQTHLIMEMVK